MPVEQLARQAQRAHRVLGVVAAGGVRQIREIRRRQGVEQARLVLVLADVGAADRHRDDLRARGLDGGARLGEVLVLAGADQQPRGVRLAGDDERVAHPPPTATTISSSSPSPISVCACALRGTISPLRSTATFFPATASRSSNAAMLSGASKRCAAPFTIT